MKTVLRFCLSLLLCVISTHGIAAQDVVKKKLAVYVTGEDIEKPLKKVIAAKIGNAITASGQYALVETSEDFLAALTKEIDRQMSGEVRSNQIIDLGKRYGVKFVVVADVSEVFDDLYINSRLINLESGLVEKSYDAIGPAESSSQLIKLAQSVASGLMGSYAGGGQYSSSSAGGAVESFTVNGVTFEMVRVDGGSYSMGSYSGESDEQPVHSESVSTFYIGRTEVTQALWAAVMRDNPSKFRGENLPVENVSWYDCQEFVERLSRLTGRIFRLPTEAEWEFAARGGIRSHGYIYSGSDDVYRVAWYTENSGGTTHPVGQKLANELGIFDMSGNVWEWTSDAYSSNYNSPRNSSNRVYRGGSWYNAASYCRVAYRNATSPGNRSNIIGLRLAL